MNKKQLVGVSPREQECILSNWTKQSNLNDYPSVLLDIIHKYCKPFEVSFEFAAVISQWSNVIGINISDSMFVGLEQIVMITWNYC